MIEKFDAMPILLSACPSFGDAWQEHLGDFGNDVLHAAAGKYAHHLLRLFQNNEVSTFLDVGLALERLIVEGAPFVKELAIVGILEGVQNIWSNNSVDPERFFPYLGLESGKAWAALNHGWSEHV